MFFYLFLISFVSIVGAFIACAYIGFKSIAVIIILAISIILTLTLYKLISVDNIIQENQKKILKLSKQQKQEIAELKQQIAALKNSSTDNATNEDSKKDE